MRYHKHNGTEHKLTSVKRHKYSAPWTFGRYTLVNFERIWCSSAPSLKIPAPWTIEDTAGENPPAHAIASLKHTKLAASTLLRWTTALDDSNNDICWTDSSET